MVLDTFCRTLKYLLGLALAVPCIGYDWVKESIKQLRRGVDGERRWEEGKERVRGEEEGRERGRELEGQRKRRWIWLLSYGVAPFLCY